MKTWAPKPEDYKSVLKFFSGCKKILDAGCGTGAWIEILGKERCIGIDIDKSALKICKNKRLKINKMDLEKHLKFKKNFFDGIFCSHVLEHLYDPLKLMKQFYMILKPDGRLLCFVPSVYVSSRTFWKDYTHVRPFTKDSLRKLALDAGFKDNKIKVYYRVFGSELFRFGKILGFFGIRNPKELVLEAIK